MRTILFLDLGSHYGGVEIYTLALANMFAARARLVSICSLPRLAGELRSQGVSVVCIPILRNKWCKAVRLLVAAVVLPYMLLRYRVDTVQLNGFFESMLLPMIRCFGRKAVYTMHGPFEDDLYTWYRNPERFFPRLVSKLCLRMANRIVCVSDAVRQVAVQSLPKEKIAVIPNWVPAATQHVSPAPLAGGILRILFVGRLEQYKGVQLILGAMRKIPLSQLTVVGDGSYRKELEGLAAGLDVDFAGFESNLAPRYQASDVFVNPSMGPEGLPLVSLEAMAAALPCVFSDLPVHREISGDGNAAVLFSSGDPNDLARSLTEIAHDEQKRKNLSANALAAIGRRYTRSAAEAQYLSLFGL